MKVLMCPIGKSNASRGIAGQKASSVRRRKRNRGRCELFRLFGRPMFPRSEESEKLAPSPKSV